MTARVEEAKSSNISQNKWRQRTKHGQEFGPQIHQPRTATEAKCCFHQTHKMSVRTKPKIQNHWRNKHLHQILFWELRGVFLTSGDLSSLLLISLTAAVIRRWPPSLGGSGSGGEMDFTSWTSRYREERERTRTRTTTRTDRTLSDVTQTQMLTEQVKF